MQRMACWICTMQSGQLGVCASTAAPLPLPLPTSHVGALPSRRTGASSSTSLKGTLGRVTMLEAGSRRRQRTMKERASGGDETATDASTASARQTDSRVSSTVVGRAETPVKWVVGRRCWREVRERRRGRGRGGGRKRHKRSSEDDAQIKQKAGHNNQDAVDIGSHAIV